jgi:hypothetical protein
LKKSELAKLDRKVFAEVRERGICERCGKRSGQVQIQCCHIFSRRFRSIRHHPDNLLALCAGCHFWAHHNPVEFSRWVESHIGREKMDELIRLKNDVKK